MWVEVRGAGADVPRDRARVTPSSGFFSDDHGLSALKTRFGEAQRGKPPRHRSPHPGRPCTWVEVRFPTGEGFMLRIVGVFGTRHRCASGPGTARMSLVFSHALPTVHAPQRLCRSTWRTTRFHGSRLTAPPPAWAQ